MGANSGDFTQTNICRSPVPAGGSCSVSAKFTPDVSGTRTASLQITHNGGGLRVL
jgi:hypothetical protein